MVDKTERSLTEYQRCWLERIQSCEAQGLSVAAYAAEHGLAVQSISYRTLPWFVSDSRFSDTADLVM